MAVVIPAVFKRPLSVLVVIFTSGGEALLLRRSDHEAFWQSVTGSLEWHEDDLLSVAQRELSEETGIVTSVGWRDWEVSHQYEIFPQWRYRYQAGTLYNTEHIFSVELDDRVAVVLRPSEHREYEWVSWKAAIARAASPTNRWALEVLGRERQFLSR